MQPSYVLATSDPSTHHINEIFYIQYPLHPYPNRLAYYIHKLHKSVTGIQKFIKDVPDLKSPPISLSTFSMELIAFLHLFNTLSSSS